MKHLLRILAVAIGFAALGAPVMAAETPVYEFDANSHVYLDPLMAQRTPLSNEFADQLVAEGRQKGLEVYLVVAQRGDEFANAPARTWAHDYTMNRLITAWKYAPGFNEHTAEIIVYLRDPASMAGSIFVYAGGILRNAGVTQDVLRADNGPVAPISRQEVRVDAQKAFLDIQASINNTIDHQPATFLGLTLGVWIIIIIVVIVLLLLCCCASGGGGGGFFFIGGCTSSSGGGGGCSSCGSDT